MAETLLRDQKVTGKRILNFTVNTEKIGEAMITLEVVQARSTLLERYWTEALQHHMQLQDHETSHIDDEYFANDLSTTYETEYSLAKSKLRAGLATFVEQAQAGGGQDVAREAPIQVQSTASSLPKLKLPTFSGKPEEWDTFKEVFCSMIKDTTSLTPVLKLQHLMSCLEGEAARRLSNFQVIGSNFDVAWSALCLRYDNKRLRQAVQLLRLLDIAPVAHRSPSEFTRLLDTAAQCIRALKQLHRPIEHWDDWFVHVMVFKLDQQTREDWEKSFEGSDDYSTYETLSSFLENRVKFLDNAHCQSATTCLTLAQTSAEVKPAAKEKTRPVTVYHALATPARTTSSTTSATSPQTNQAKDPCAMCKGSHFVAHCPAYLQSTIPHKESVIEQLHLCKNCLRAHHASPSCPSKYRCRVCQADHHTTLHRGTPTGEFLPPGPRPQLSPSPAPGQQRTPQSYVSRMGSPILLETARVILQSSTGLSPDVQVLIDPASEGHMLTEYVAQLLRLKKSTTQTNVKGVGGVTTKATSTATVAIRSKMNSKFVLSFSAMVLPRITSLLPSTRVERQSWPHLDGLELADPEFYMPDEVDGILGADIYSLIIQEGLRIGAPGSPVGQLTKLGWILTGPTGHPESETNEVSSFVVTFRPATSLADELRRFWKLEEVPSTRTLTPDEQYCKDHFARTHERDASGRYVLRLPFRAIPTLDSNRHTAVVRMQQVERRLARDSALAAQYQRFIDEYEQLGHLETIPAEHLDARPHWYIPHRAIMKTKLRVVFDGSCGSPSLNECLHSGAKLQLDICAVILRWRLFQFAFTADIVKIYQQIRIHPEDTDWLRILMRASPDQALSDKRLLTVTYRTNCALFQALRTMLQLAEDEGADLSLGADVHYASTST